MNENLTIENKEKEITYFDIVSLPETYILVQCLDFFFFILTFFILYLLSYKYIINMGNLYFLIFCISSILFIKPEFILRAENMLHKANIEKYESIGSIWKSLLNKKFLTRFILIFPRLLFFNIIYYMFPIFVVLIFLFSILFYFEKINLQESSNFIQIMGLIGLTSGFFQYYIKRYEEKVQGKIVSMMSFIQNLIIEESTYKNFEKFIDGIRKYKSIKTDIKIDEVPNNKPFFPSVMKTFIERGRAQIFAPVVHLDKFDQNINFKIIEKKNDKELLLEAYGDFFKNVKREVKSKIEKKEFLVKELTMLLLSNIRFIFETAPEFLQLSTEIKDDTKLETYSDFLREAILDITNEVLTENVLK